MKHAAVLGLLFATFACARGPIDREIDSKTPSLNRDTNRPTASLFRDGSYLTSTAGSLSGAIGTVASLDGSGRQVAFYDDGMYTQASLVTSGSNGAAMAILGMSGSVRQLSVGDEVRTCESDYSDPESAVNTGGIAASVTGCAGSQEGSWDYDQPATCTSIGVEEPMEGAPVDAVASVTVLAHWDEGTDWATGLPIPAREAKAVFHIVEE